MTGHDLRLALRGCGARPGFSMAVVGLLGLGIAANAAVFSVVDALFLRPLPFAQADRLLDLNERAPGVDLPFIYIADPDADAWRRGNTTFASMAFYDEQGQNLGSGGAVERIRALRTTAGLHAVLGARPILGRELTPEDERPGAAAVALLGHALWLRAFGGDPAVLGRTIRLGDTPHTVVGVLPPGLAFPRRTDVWTPLALDPSPSVSFWHLRGVGLMKPGVTAAQASADLLRVHRGLVALGRKANEGTEPLLQPLRDRYLGRFRASAHALTGACLTLLLIACVNVAALLSLRAAGRAREGALRAALGAGRREVARPLLAEALLLAAAGGTLGLVLGAALFKALVAWMPADTPEWVVFRFDVRFALAGLGLTAMAALGCSTWPALLASRVDLRAVLAEGSGRSSLGRGSRRTLAGMVVAEVALAVVLLAGAGLAVQAFRRLVAVDPGFRADDVVTFRVGLPEAAYPTSESRSAFAATLLDRLRAIPGVTAAGGASYLPLEPAGMTGVEVEGRASAVDGRDPAVLHVALTPGYVEAIGMQLVAGRAFDARDGVAGGAGAAIVSEGFARWAWPDGAAVGRHVRGRGSQRWLEVVGIVRDLRQVSLEQDARMALFEPYAQLPVPSLAFAARGPAGAVLAGSVRAALRAIDPELPAFDVATMDERLRESLGGRRAASWLAGLFAIVALLLASGGVYGVVAYGVQQRTREIAIRVALGARPAVVLREVLARGALLAGAGLLIGVAAIQLLGSSLRPVLSGVSPHDPMTLAAVGLVVGSAALLANAVPAHRAAAVDPNRVLRSE